MRFLTALFALVLLAAPLSAETAMGDDGLHTTEWMHDTFKDLREDLADARRFCAVIDADGTNCIPVVHQ